jgi:hypothetical protein
VKKTGDISRLSQRHPSPIINDLKKISDQSGVSQVSLIAACICGLKKTWKLEGELTFPFVVISEKKYLDLLEKQND